MSTGEHLTYRVYGRYSHYDENDEWTLCWRADEWTLCWRATFEDASAVLELLDRERLQFGEWCRAEVEYSRSRQAGGPPMTFAEIQARIEARCLGTIERWPDLTAWRHTRYDVEVMSDDPYSRRRGAVKELG